MVAIDAARPWCPWCDDHMGWWGAGWMMLVWLLLLVAVVVVVWALVRRSGGAGQPEGEDRAEAVLRERYARGEIDEATYRRMLDEIRR